MKTIWYCLAFGISVTLHATLLLFGDPTQTSQIPVQQGHASLAINPLPAIQSQASPPTPAPAPEVEVEVETPTVPEAEKVPDTFTVPTFTVPEAEPAPLAAPVIEHIMPTLPRIVEPLPVEEPIIQQPSVIRPAKTIQPTPTVVETQPVKEQVVEQSQTDTANQPAPESVASNSDLLPQGVTTQAKRPDSFKPVYPMLFRRRGIEGTVTMQIQITATGIARSVIVTQSSGYRQFDAAAVKECRSVRYIPAMKHGRPVESTLTFDVVFRLQSDS